MFLLNEVNIEDLVNKRILILFVGKLRIILAIHFVEIFFQTNQAINLEISVFKVYICICVDSDNN